MGLFSLFRKKETPKQQIVLPQATVYDHISADKKIMLWDGYKQVDIGDYDSGFSGDIECVSPSGEFYLAFGTNNRSGDEYFFVFTKEKMIYSKKFDGLITYSHLFDDGVLALIDDDYLIKIYEADGKQRCRMEYDNGCMAAVTLSGNVLFIHGSKNDGSGNAVLWVYNHEAGKAWRKDIDIPDEQYEAYDENENILNVTLEGDVFAVSIEGNVFLRYALDGKKLR